MKINVEVDEFGRSGVRCSCEGFAVPPVRPAHPRPARSVATCVGERRGMSGADAAYGCSYVMHCVMHYAMHYVMHCVMHHVMHYVMRAASHSCPR